MIRTTRTKMQLIKNLPVIKGSWSHPFHRPVINKSASENRTRKSRHFNRRSDQPMDLEAVKQLLEKKDTTTTVSIDSMRERFFEPFIMEGLKLEKIEPGVVICSMKVPPRLLNAGGFLHGGATATLVDLVGSAAVYAAGAKMTGVSVEINVSYLDAAFEGEEVEIEARVLRAGKAIAVVSVEIRRKGSGKIVAQGRHTKYIAVASKL